MSRSAFLVIDMLNDFFLEEPLSSRRSGLVSAINDVVRIFRKNGQPIIWVRQEFKPDLSDAFLAMRKEDTRITIAGTEGAQILTELDVERADCVIVKHRYSAFFRTPLDDVLSTMKPDVLVVGEVNNHACVRATVIGSRSAGHPRPHRESKGRHVRAPRATTRRALSVPPPRR